MKYGYVGRSNLIASKVCLGTMHFGAATPKQEAFRILDLALDSGINIIDTANVYNRGKTEEIIGEWLSQDKTRRDKVIIATKFYGHLEPGLPAEELGVSMLKARRHLEGSLRRLQTDYIDIYQSHHIDKHVTDAEFWDMMQLMINQGKVLYAGACNSAGWSLAKQQMAAKARNIFGFITEQSSYSLLNRFIELEVVPAAREFGIGILSYMPLAGGILTGKKQAVKGSRTEFVTREFEYDMEESEQLPAYSALCRQLGEKEHVVAAAWTIHNPVVACTIVGPRTTSHLSDVERIADLKLPSDFLAELDRLFTYQNGRPLRPGTEAPFAYAGLAAKERHFIDYYEPRKEYRALAGNYEPYYRESVKPYPGGKGEC